MAAFDEYGGFPPNVPNGPFNDGAAVTPHDVNELTHVSRGLYCGSSGNIVAVTVKGTTLTFLGLAVGTILPGRFKIVKATGTTVTGIVSLFD